MIIDPCGEYIKKLNPLVVVDAILAKKNLGTKMLEYAFNYLKSLNWHTLIVHSQLQAKEFYSKLGFKEHGDIFYEENHPHIEMIKKL